LKKAEVKDIQDLLSMVLDLKPKLSIESLTAKTRFQQDMGFDSLAMASLFYELEEKYPDLNEVDVKNWKTIEDCLNSINKSK
jgi:acyl carrier protein